MEPCSGITTFDSLGSIITMVTGLSDGVDGQEQRIVEHPYLKETNFLLTEANKALVHQFFEEVLSKGNMTVADELLDTDYISSRNEYMPGLPSGLKGFKYLMSLFHAAFPNGHFDTLTIQSHPIEEDLIVANYKWHGVNTGDLIGQLPIRKTWVFILPGETCGKFVMLPPKVSKGTDCDLLAFPLLKNGDPETFTFVGKSLFRIANGKIVRSWYSFDTFAANILAQYYSSWHEVPSSGYLGLGVK